MRVRLPPRCRPMMVDESTGAAYPMPEGTGADFGADSYGADFGADFGGDGSDDDLMGADLMGADPDPHLDRIENRIASLTEKFDKIKHTGPLATRHKRHLLDRIRKLRSESESIKRKHAEDARRLAAATRGQRSIVNTATGQGRPVSVVDSVEANRAAAMGGRIYQTVAPPASGSLQRIPFFGTVAPTNLARTIFTAGVVGATATQTLSTEDLPYEVTLVKGFVTETTASLQGGGASGQSTAYVAQLKSKGFPNMFSHEGFQDARVYATDTDHLVGLRDTNKFVIKSPNVVTVQVSAFIGIANDVVLLACSAVVDRLSDDTFGPGVLQPYNQ